MSEPTTDSIEKMLDDLAKTERKLSEKLVLMAMENDDIQALLAESRTWFALSDSGAIK